MVRATEKVVQLWDRPLLAGNEAVELDLEIIGMAMTAVSNWMWEKRQRFLVDLSSWPWMCFTFMIRIIGHF